MDIICEQRPGRPDASRYEDGFITAASMALIGFSLVILAVVYDIKWLAFAAGGVSAAAFAVFYLILFGKILKRRPPGNFGA